MESSYSTFLFAMPSVAEGAGRILDFGNQMTEYNDSASNEEADCAAIAADWHAVGQSLYAALIESAAENGLEVPCPSREK